MTTSNRRGQANLPTATAHEHRLLIYQATRRPVYRLETISTPWGAIRIKGKLGQPQADMMDAILYCAERSREIEDGRIKILVDPARVRRVAGISSGEQFNRLQDDLLSAVVEILEPVALRGVGHLVDHIETAKRRDGTHIVRGNPFGGVRHLWRVELGNALCTLLQKDIWRGYDPTPIAQLRHGISQAVVRHVLTHTNVPHGGWTLDGLIRVVTGDVLGQQLRDRRREVREDSEKMAVAGVVIAGDRVYQRGVEQKPRGVGQKPRGVGQKPGPWSKSLRLAD